jgi:predicted S18 family serine protease
MIATERLQDVERALQEINDSNPSPAQLAYATERFETARAWFSVVGSIRGTELDLSQEALDASCRLKLDEARERVNYASFLFPQVASQLEQSLRDALGAAQRQHSALCILQASQAKAEANSILTALSVPESGFEAVTQRKSAIARERIAAQTERGTFPVLAYSYSEYSESFPETDSATGALYTEYSLELSSLPSNFALENHFMRLDKTMLTVFILGAMLGAIIGLVGGFFLYRPPKARKR